MQRKAALRRVCSAASCGSGDGPSPFPRSECEPARGFGRGETLVFVLLLSFGLWALIWGAVSLVGAYGLR
jgi:nitrate reductase NapE component